MNSISFTEIQTLHKKYAPSEEVYKLVFTHCQIVCDIAEQLIAHNNLEIDAELVRSGCLLHDIGVYPLFNGDGKLREGTHYITHGLEGEGILKAEGLPELIWRFASHHTGVGLTKQDVINQQLPLPVEDYLATTDEEALVMYADKFHSKTSPPVFNSYERYKQKVTEFGENKVADFERLAQKFGIPDLAPLAEKYGYEIR